MPAWVMQEHHSVIFEVTTSEVVGMALVVVITVSETRGGSTVEARVEVIPGAKAEAAKAATTLGATTATGPRGDWVQMAWSLRVAVE